MARLVLRYRGSGSRPDADAARIGALPGVEIVDDSSRMLLVEGPEDALRAALAALPGWTIAEEGSIPLPDVRRRPRGSS
jgi:hypothetical protein